MEPNAARTPRAHEPTELSISASKYGSIAGGRKDRVLRTLTRTTAEQKYTYYVLLLLPFAVFCAASYALGFAYFSSPVEARFAVCAAAVVPVWYALKASRAESDEEAHHARILTVTNGMALLGGAAFGYFVYSTFVFTYFATLNSQTYTNVTPKQVATGLADAGRITFSAETWVDASRGVGYTGPGHMYCVAPVMDASTEKEVQYWAIGEDCCIWRGGFKCGDFTGDKQKPAMVDLFPADGFTDAVNLAVAENDLISADGAIFLRFYADVDAQLQQLWTDGILVFVSGVMLAFGVSFFGTKALENVL